MNILEVSFDNLLRDLALARGLDMAAGEVSPGIARQMASALTRAAEYAYSVADWREVCVTVTALTHPDSTLRGGALLAPGYTVLGVYAENPGTAYAAGESPTIVPHRTTTDGTLELQEAPASAWYRVRLAAPVFCADDWDSTKNYAPGDGCHTPAEDVTTPGDSWRALLGNLNAEPIGFEDWRESTDLVPDVWYRAAGVLWKCIHAGTASDSNYPASGADWETYFDPTPHTWAPQRLPQFLKEAVLEGAAAFLQRHADGQLSSYSAAKRAMDEVLESLVINRYQPNT